VRYEGGPEGQGINMKGRGREEEEEGKRRKGGVWGGVVGETSAGDKKTT